MNTLSPFIYHTMENLPGPSTAPEASGSLNSPPLGKPPRAAQPDPASVGRSPAGKADTAGAAVQNDDATRGMFEATDPAARREAAERGVVIPPSQPDNPGVQLPPSTAQTPHPGPESAPQAGIPYTHGTPAPFRQKNAACFQEDTTPGVMAYYMPENNRMDRDAPPQAALPTQEDDETVERLLQWREESAY